MGCKLHARPPRGTRECLNAGSSGGRQGVTKHPLIGSTIIMSAGRSERCSTYEREHRHESDADFRWGVGDSTFRVAGHVGACLMSTRCRYFGVDDLCVFEQVTNVAVFRESAGMRSVCRTGIDLTGFPIGAAFDVHSGSFRLAESAMTVTHAADEDRSEVAEVEPHRKLSTQRVIPPCPLSGQWDAAAVIFC